MKLYIMSGSFKRGRVTLDDVLEMKSDAGIDSVSVKEIARASARSRRKAGLGSRLSTMAADGLAELLERQDGTL